ncbi:hypothetical protein NQ314_014647 [Rhamnusium bicolor]|uniref:Endonuclease/exonuclease/phosphatase domain-containing protein n=1 Tax=Rhamnusium bicolor TaxID=1586634 RepID=A0AAV8X1V1_9CUCU|nr:hypothetical protein NQ314_014647 [Rhamnusium bicolor]
MQTVCESKIDVIIGQEPNKNKSVITYCDLDVDCFIYIVNRNITVISCSRDSGFVCVELSDVFIFSRYFSPNKGTEEFERYLYKLGKHINKNKNKHIIIGGDLNSKAQIFGSSVVNEKGRILEEWIESSDLVVLNKGNTPTFSNANGNSLIDVTMAMAEISKRIDTWYVDVETENMSPHRNIRFDLTGTIETKTSPTRKKGWKVTADGLQELADTGAEISLDRQNGRITPQELTLATKEMCDKFLPRKRPCIQGHRSVYWWTSEIAELRKNCIRQRRFDVRINRTAATPERKAEARAAYKEAKRNLQLAINKQKKETWLQLCNELENDV